MRTLGKAVAMLLTVFGFIGSLGVVAEDFGPAVTIVALVLAPLSAAVVPWYVWLRYESPLLLIVTYAGFVLFALVYREREPPHTLS